MCENWLRIIVHVHYCFYRMQSTFNSSFWRPSHSRISGNRGRDVVPGCASVSRGNQQRICNLIETPITASNAAGDQAIVGCCCCCWRWLGTCRHHHSGFSICFQQALYWRIRSSLKKLKWCKRVILDKHSGLVVVYLYLYFILKTHSHLTHYDIDSMSKACVLKDKQA